jgi:hypothetical protein
LLPFCQCFAEAAHICSRRLEPVKIAGSLCARPRE